MKRDERSNKKGQPIILGEISRNEKQTYSNLGRMTAKANQVSGLTIG